MENSGHSPTPKVSFCNAPRFNQTVKGNDLLFPLLSQERWIKRNWVLELYCKINEKEYLRELSNYYGFSNRVYYRIAEKTIIESWQLDNILFKPTKIMGIPSISLKTRYTGKTFDLENKNNDPGLQTVLEGFSIEMERAWNKTQKNAAFSKILTKTISFESNIIPHKKLITPIKKIKSDFIFFKSKT